jgi:hypothetical protein
MTTALKIPDSLAGTGTHPRMRWRTKWKLPSYVSSRTFSSALVHTLVPSPIDGTTAFDQLKSAVDSVGNDQLRKVLLGHIDEAKEDVERFRRAVEGWYDDHMKRVSGWYKRHTRWYTLAVATVLATFFNVNTVAMAQALYADEALRESVVTAAFSAADCTADDTVSETTGGTSDDPTGGTSGGITPAECLQDVRNQIDHLRGTGLPIGWAPNRVCVVVDADRRPVSDDDAKCSWLEQIGLTDPTRVGGEGVSQDRGLVLDLTHFALVLLGWAIIATASLVGARFWFDALSRLGSLRSTGPKPDVST